MGESVYNYEKRNANTMEIGQRNFATDIPFQNIHHRFGQQQKEFNQTSSNLQLKVKINEGGFFKSYG
jgi:hypothetical protein